MKGKDITLCMFMCVCNFTTWLGVILKSPSEAVFNCGNKNYVQTCSFPPKCRGADLTLTSVTCSDDVTNLRNNNACDERTCSSPPFRSSSSFGRPGSGPGLPLCRHQRASSDALQENGPSRRRLWSLKPVLTDRSCRSSCSDTAWSGSGKTIIPFNSFNTFNPFKNGQQHWIDIVEKDLRLLELSLSQNFINFKSQISKQELGTENVTEKMEANQ